MPGMAAPGFAPGVVVTPVGNFLSFSFNFFIYFFFSILLHFYFLIFMLSLFSLTPSNFWYSFRLPGTNYFPSPQEFLRLWWSNGDLKK